MASLRSLEAWLLTGTGLMWLDFAGDGGMVRALLAGATGTVLLGTGVAALLLPGDRRILSFAALAGAVGLLYAVLGVFGHGLGSALGLLVLSAVAVVASGRLSLDWVAPATGLPAPRETVLLAAKVAADEALLATLHLRLRFPDADGARRVIDETRDASELFRERGWLEKPLSYHRTPISLDTPRIQSKRVRGVDYEHLVFDSEYEPWPEEPGRERWLANASNRTAHAYVVRGDPEKPWLVAINGYRMGMALTDLAIFDPRVFHRKLGLNLLIPVLPLHGPRRSGTFSGDGFMDGDPMALLHAESQAMWDIRRLVGWVREQGADRIGVYGLSLGGYNAALLASVEDGLACAIPGIALVDFAEIFWTHGGQDVLRHFEAGGLTCESLRELLRPVSPLALEPKVPREARSMFGGVADRIVPPGQTRDLAEHWQPARLEWIQSGHVTFFGRRVTSLIQDTLREHLIA